MSELQRRQMAGGLNEQQRLTYAVVEALRIAGVSILALEGDGQRVIARDEKYEYVFQWFPKIPANSPEEVLEGYYVETEKVVARPPGADRDFARHFHLENAICDAIVAERGRSGGLVELFRE